MKLKQDDETHMTHFAMNMENIFSLSTDYNTVLSLVSSSPILLNLSRSWTQARYCRPSTPSIISSSNILPENQQNVSQTNAHAEQRQTKRHGCPKQMGTVP